MRRKTISRDRISFYRKVLKRKECAYCVFLKAVVSWWCDNDKAVEYRGTAIPAVYNCKFYKPDKGYIRRCYKKGELNGL